MAIQITFDNYPNRTYSIDLEGTLFKINMKYNTVDGKWYFSLRDADDNSLLVGHKVTINRPVLGQYQRPDFPQGEFVFTLPTAERDPGRDDIQDLLLVYITEAEYEQVR